MIEGFSAKSEISKVSCGLIRAITMVQFGMEGRIEKQKEYESQGKELLNYLASPESPINKSYPHIIEEHGDVIEKARENFPREESLNYLQELLEMSIKLELQRRRQL